MQSLILNAFKGQEIKKKYIYIMNFLVLLRAAILCTFFLGRIRIIFSFHIGGVVESTLSSPENVNTLPTIKLEVLESDEKLYGYSIRTARSYYSDYSDTSANSRRVPVPSPLRFKNEQIVFWEISNPSETENQIRLRFRMTCEAPYITKWNITTNSKEINTSKASQLSYSIKQFSRDNEDPLQSDSKYVFYFNLTELTIHSFESTFQSAFIDCTHRSNYSLKTRLYIFQRFLSQNSEEVVGKSFFDSTSKNLKLDFDTAIPCKVHDPILSPQLYYRNHSLMAWIDVTTLFNYDWKQGFVNYTHENQFQIGDMFQCVLQSDGNVILNVEYTFEVDFSLRRTGQKKGADTSNSDGLQQVLDLLATPNGTTFICKLTDKSELNADPLRALTETLNRIELEPCVSPDYCSLNGISSSKLNDTDKLCSDSEANECNLLLPTNYTSNGILKLEGKITCYSVIRSTNQIQRTEQYYFTGLSGRIYFQSDMPPLKDIIEMTIVYDEESKEARISCSSVKFLSFPTFKFSVTLKNGTQKLLSRTDYYEISVENNNELRIQRKVIALEKTFIQDEILSISCHVPWYNSTEWMEATEDYSQLDLPQGRNEDIPIITTEVAISSVIAVVMILLIILLIWFMKRHCVIEFCCCPPNRTDVVNCENLTSEELKELQSILKTQRNIPSKFFISKQHIAPNEDKIFGEGQFSKLCPGYLKQRYYGRNNVNLKMNKVTGDPVQIAAMLNDVHIRILIAEQEQHNNIVSFHGVYIDSADLKMNVCNLAPSHLRPQNDTFASNDEIMTNAAGKVYIAMNPEHAGSIRDYMTIGHIGREKLLNTCPSKRLQSFTTWLRGITNGMKFLHQLQIVHGNLAAENILLFPNNSVKITGFSHSHQLRANSSYYIKKRSWSWEFSGWKWMPAESLRFMEFSKESDVWSFGIVMWEIFSLGASPYMEDGYFHFTLDFVVRLEQGLRLGQPNSTPNLMYKKMMECWSRFGKDRPTFNALNTSFNEMLAGLRYEIK